MIKRILLPPLLALLIVYLLPGRAAAEEWPAVFDPYKVVTLNFELDPEIWTAITYDENFYDPERNIRVPVLMWADGEEPITVQMRRKSDPALEANGIRKVSLKIDINEFVKGQRWRDLTKLSLENGAGGNGPVREGLSMNLHRLASEHGFYEWSAGYASWVRVVVNGQYIGLYASPEQRDKQFLRNRGLYKPGSVWMYEVNGGTHLDTTIADTHSPTYNHLCYLPFRDTCPQPNLEAVLPQWIHMDGMLTLAAIEAFTGNSDGMFTKEGKNSFVVDFLPSNQHRRWYLPWDLDNGMTNTTFDIFTGGSGPQRNRPYQIHILAHPWFGLQYRHIMSDLLNGPLSPAVLNAFITELEAVLAPHLAEDVNNMMGGADAAAVASHFQAIRNWVIARNTNVRGQIGTLLAPPVFSQDGGEIVSGFALVLHHSNDTGTIYFTTDGSDPRAVGGAPAGTAYTGPIILDGTRHVKARVLKGTEWSALREATFTVAGHAAGLAITEIMYRPLKDEQEGIGELEFIEVKNTGSTPIDLSGLSFTNGIQYDFPKGRVLQPGEFLVLGENEGHFQQRYGKKPFQVYLRKLSNDGERLTIRDALGARVFSVRYEPGAPWPVLANGHGFSLVPVDPNQNSNPDDPSNWRASASVGGSPGADDPEPTVPVVFVTEALAHTDLPLRDAIEIHNPNDSPVDITGWFLSDKLTTPKRWKIPPTVIEPGEYVVFYESDEFGNIFDEHFGSSFALSASGEEVYIFSADAAENLTGFSHGFSFGASENGVSFGRYITSIGEEHFVAQNERTLGGPNSGPLVGPVVITELMYNPAGTNDEFVELMNITSGPVKLYDPQNPKNTWRIGGIAWEFPQGIELAAHEIILVVPVEPEAFRTRYSIPAAVRVFGPYTGNLSNSGERIRLRKPDAPNLVNELWVVPYIDVDSVTYADRDPWPAEPDGSGPSLERIDPAAYADDPANWRSSRKEGGTPGYLDQESTPPPALSYQSWAAEHRLTGPDAAPEADPDGDGIVNLLEYAFGLDPTVNSSSGLPVLDQIAEDGVAYLTLTFYRRRDASDVEFAAEFGDLEAWTAEAAVTISVSASPEDGTLEVVTMRDSVPMTDSSRRFGRVRVSLE
jgi:hypothetical protein